MHIVIVAATALEIQPLLDLRQTAGIDTTGWEVLITGVGAVATTFSLMETIARKKPGLMIQAGIAGGFEKSLQARVVTIREELFADMGVWEVDGFKSLFDLGLTGMNEEPFSDGMLKNTHARLLSLSGLELVRSISVNELTTNPERIAWYRKHLSPVVENMEGGAFHFVCLQKQIPFLQLRAISNEIGERDKSKWQLKDAIYILNKKLVALITELKQQHETYIGV
jgi:futalosine hydrolase